MKARLQGEKSFLPGADEVDLSRRCCLVVGMFSLCLFGGNTTAAVRKCEDEDVKE